MNTKPLKTYFEQGFTLVELMIGICIAAVLLGSVYQIYTSNQRSALRQEEQTYLQQTLRSAMLLLQQDIRMAGLDPTGDAGSGVSEAQSTRFSFSKDERGAASGSAPDGDLDDPNENLVFFLSGTNLMRQSGGSADILGENIDGLAFAYAYDSNGDGHVDFNDANGNGSRDAGEAVLWAVDTNGNGDLDRLLDADKDEKIEVGDFAPLPGGSEVPLTSVRAVRIWVLGRTKKTIPGHRDDDVYVFGDQVFDPGTEYQPKRSMSELTVQCRNMGLP
jgi:type IV pilus assembly protein PilW